MDASLIQSLVGETVGVIVGNAATLIAALIIGLLANWELALVVFAILPLFGLQGFAQMKRSQGFGIRTKVTSFHRLGFSCLVLECCL